MTATAEVARPAAPPPPAALVAPRWFIAAAVGAVGGPLALVTLYAGDTFTELGSAAPLAALVALGAFAAPVAIWCAYSRHVVGPGGLTAYTTAAAGRVVGGAQATFWIGSYFLYLLYTSDYVVRDVLPTAWSGSAGWASALDVALPAAVVGVVLLPLRRSVAVLAAVAIGQVVLALGLVAVALTSVGGASTTNTATAGALTSGGIGMSLFFVCGSLPIYLGGEVRDGGRTVRRALVIAVVVAGAVLAAAAFAHSAYARFNDGEAPGVAIARSAVGAPGAVVIAAGTAASILALMVIEYLALSRLLHAVTARPAGSVVRWLAVPVAGAAVVSAVHPFYDQLLRPSLIALWVAQVIPVACYPRFVARVRRLRTFDIAAALSASALFSYGLYAALTASGGS